MYDVELDDGDFVTVSRSSVFMTEDQARILREMMVATPSPMKSTNRMADVSLGESRFVYCWNSDQIVVLMVEIRSFSGM
jgi:hypothetical protein